MSIDVNDKNWDSEVINSKVPVVVDFWANWCAPCKAMSPVLDEIEKEMNGKIKLVKVDIEANMDMARNQKLKSVPTLIIFKDGKAINRTVGHTNKEVLVKFIGDNI